VRADRDMADGYRYGRTYLCRHCGEIIPIHNHEWQHTERWGFGTACVKRGSGSAGKQAHPVPFGTVHVFDEELVSGPYQNLMRKTAFEVRCELCSKLVSVRDDAKILGWCHCEGTSGMNGKHRQVVPTGVILPGSENPVSIGST